MSTPIPTNKAPFSSEELSVLTGGELVRHEGPLDIVGVSTDTRTLVTGNAFVALRGDRFDGHEHLGKAAACGAAVAVVARDAVKAGLSAPAGLPLLCVDDPLVALGDLGRGHRRRWSARRLARRSAFGVSPRVPTVVAITGSAGKTTTRLAVETLLRSMGVRVHAATGNLNNAIGVPMVLLGLESTHDVAVVEIGTNAPGEIAYGAAIAEPDIGLITLVAAAHTEKLGSVEQVAHEKGAMFAALPTSGFAIANLDDRRVAAQLHRSPAARWLGVGSSVGADVRIVDRHPKGFATSALTLELGPVGRVSIDTPLIGQAGAYATAFAIAVAGALGRSQWSPGELTSAFKPVEQLIGGRLAPISLPDGTVVLDDGYNANGASMAASIQTAHELSRDVGRRLVLVLGEMLELGDLAVEQHSRIGEIIASVIPDALIAVQGEARRFARAAEGAGVDAMFVPDSLAAAAAVLEVVRPGDLVLVKGSNSIGLSRVVAALKERPPRRTSYPPPNDTGEATTPASVPVPPSSLRPASTPAPPHVAPPGEIGGANGNTNE